jgi:hypothetical protein
MHLRLRYRDLSAVMPAGPDQKRVLYNELDSSVLSDRF